MHETGAPTGAELTLDVLRDEGVRHLFGNPGTTELPLVQQVARQHDISYVLALQEASAVAMADGYARITGRPAVANLHAAAGLGNSIGALTNAAAARVPMVVTAGQQDLRHLIHAPVLAGDLTALTAGTVKWAHQVSTREELGEVLRHAFRVAAAPPTGPVFVSLPMNLLDAPGPAAPPRSPVLRAAAAPIQEPAELLSQAPPGSIALVYGDELARHAPAEGQALAEALNAPVWAAGWPATNPLPTTHPLWRGYLPTHVTGIRDTLAPYRTVLLVGAHPFPLYYPYSPGPPLASDTTVVQITSDPTGPGRDTPVTCSVVGHLRPTLEALLDTLPAAAATADTVPTSWPASPTPGTLDSAEWARTVARNLPDGALVVDEAPQATRHLRTALRLEQANLYQWVSGGLGWAMPAAVGAALTRPGPVLCTLGDGAAMYSPQALWTAAHLGLPIGYLIANNREYRVLKDNWRHRDNQARSYLGMDLTDPPLDFTALARAMGVPAQQVTTPDGLADAIHHGYRTGGPFLVDAVVASS
ncbi:thiamine pyrophosphate-binding protein [Streptomyces sp. RKND-216]|uniref:thiamine pyrophosphate-binding protein n=1 Tax=Streptomyces sp. RKND-216 TaxID=2562581 RepID=UPI001FF77F84|nr:thiamine pyrophosphate-binding protein [Streptomyces sp. RKND-216]